MPSIYLKGKKISINNNIFRIFCLLIVALFSINTDIVGKQARLLIMTTISCGGVLCAIHKQESSSMMTHNSLYKIITIFGTASFSIFVWHQAIIAFYLYIVNALPQFQDYATLLAIIVVASYISYMFIEKPLSKAPKKIVLITCGIVCALTSIASIAVYKNAGVVRDVPELDINCNNIHRGMHAEYCDRIYKLNTPFDNDGRIKVLTIGDSFARDFANVLLESNMSDSISMRYLFPLHEYKSDEISLLQEADVVFFKAAWMETEPKLYNATTSLAKKDTPIYGIGSKAFGQNNGNVYSKRGEPDYYDTRIKLSSWYVNYYLDEKNAWGDNYVDFMAPLLDENGSMPAFTDTHKYISQDCKHLTRAGAIYYSKLLNLKKFIK